MTIAVKTVVKIEFLTEVFSRTLFAVGNLRPRALAGETRVNAGIRAQMAGALTRFKESLTPDARQNINVRPHVVHTRTVIVVVVTERFEIALILCFSRPRALSKIIK